VSRKLRANIASDLDADRFVVLAGTLDLIGDEQLLIDTAYANQHSQRTKPSSDFRYLNHMRGICEEARVVSYNDQAFLRGVRNELWERFPDPCPWEAGDVARIQTLGVIDSARMYACESLGNPVRVVGKTVIFECRKFGEAALFGEAEHVCERCELYRMTQKVVAIGSRRPAFPIAGPSKCSRRPAKVTFGIQAVAVTLLRNT